MKILALLVALFLATATTDSIATGGAASADVLRKPKLRIYILAGQSNMEGKGHIRHITWLKENAEPEERKLFDRIHRNGKFLDVKRVHIRYKGRIGPLNVGWGTNRELIGPEYAFGLTMAEASAGDILLLKVSEGGKTLKTEFLPPNSGGPGRLYSEIVDMVKDATGGLKRYVPSYGGQGYRIEGLVWFQGFNDNIDRDQKAEGFKSYAERLDNLLKDLRSDLEAPDMKMVIGQLGFNKSPSPFNKAQKSVADLKRNAQSVRYVPIAELADAEVLKRYQNWQDHEESWAEVGADRPYHYYGSFLHFFRFGRSFANAMLDMTPRYTLSTIRKDLDKNTMPLFRALAGKKYVDAYGICIGLESSLADGKDLYGNDPAKLEVAHEVFGFLRNTLHRDLDDAIASLKEHRGKGDVYMLKQALSASLKKYTGIDEYDEIAAPEAERFANTADRALRSELSLGRTYYGLIKNLRKKRTKGRLKSLQKFAQKNPESVYGKAAAAAATALAGNETAKPRNGGSYLK
jgi:alpha-galactosidase